MSTRPTSEAGPAEARHAALRRLPLFADLDAEDLAQLDEMASRLLLPAGARFIEEGASGDALYVILRGEVEISRREGAREIVLATRGGGEFIGEMSLLEQAPRSASARTITETELLVISQAAFRTLLACSPSAPMTLLRTITTRLRSTESQLMQQAKLAALGTLAAGLAHELNNPAAAIQRSAEHLRASLAAWERAAAALGAEAPPPLAAPGSRRQQGSARETAAQEAALEDWLAQAGVEEPWEAAPVLAAAGWDVPRLQALPGEAPLAARVRWLAAATAAHALVDEIGQCARAISEIVRAAKTYARRDEAPLQTVDLHESLESTLVILRHKLKRGVRVVRDFAPNLPPIEGYGSELNQAWTNLLDNAIDAMDGNGELRLGTRQRGDVVQVDVVDSGSGIPEEALPRLFDPFFTTKPPGHGTGLGLHLVYNIVVHRHRGQIDVDSRPGCTRFRVTLPARLAAG